MGLICFFNTAIAWGGGEKWHLETSTYLFKKGYNIIVFAHPKSELLKRLQKTGIPCVSIAITNLSFLNPLSHYKLQKLFRKHGISTIVMNLSRDVKIAGPSAKAIGTKRIIYRRGSAIPIKNTFLNRYYFKNIITEVLANSIATKKTVLHYNKALFPENNITVIYNGINTSLSKEKQASIKKEESFTLVNLGRLEEQKNQSFLLDVAKVLKDKNFPIKTIIGGDGRLKGNLEKKIEDLQLQDVVTLAGFIDNPLEFISKGNVFVLSSKWEGFGYVLAEASLCKKPIIAFNISSNPELVLHKKTGLLVPPEDVTLFADAIIDLYQNPKKVNILGEAGQKYIRTNFDKKKNLKKIETYLIRG